jgi:uncharacterized phage protein (TIGR02218 family)
MCQFDRTSLQAAFACLEGSTETQILGNSNPTPSGLYVQGTISGLTGANAGYSRTVSAMSSGTVSVKLAFLSPPAAGDQFQLLPGCDRTVATCMNVFNNSIHFGGFPYVPTPETAI